VIITRKGDNPTDMNNSLRDSLLDAWGELRCFRKPQVLAGQQKDKPDIIDISQHILVVRMLLGVSSSWISREKNDDTYLAFLLHKKGESFESKATVCLADLDNISATHGESLNL